MEALEGGNLADLTEAFKETIFMKIFPALHFSNTGNFNIQSNMYTRTVSYTTTFLKTHQINALQCLHCS